MQLKKWNWVLLSLQWLVYGICVIDGICIAQGLSFLGTTLGNLVSGLFFAILARIAAAAVDVGVYRNMIPHSKAGHTGAQPAAAADPRTVCTVPVPGNAHHMAASVAGQSATL